MMIGAGTGPARFQSNGERIWRFVSKLPHEQRQVVVMRFIDDLPYQEVAHVLGKSVGAVRVIQFRALAALRRMVQQEELALAYSEARAS